MIKKTKQKKGILFWITGLSGSGKTSVIKLENQLQKIWPNYRNQW